MAFAKYYGRYGEIERGFVTQALSDLTGCESEEVSLSRASRGAGKGALWASLQRYKPSVQALSALITQVEKSVTAVSCLVPHTRCIDVRWVDGHKLIKLRNPPGDHEEWQGDFGDNSPL